MKHAESHELPGTETPTLDRRSSEWAYLRGFLRALRATTPIAEHQIRQSAIVPKMSASRGGSRHAS
jgi:hypothetical protein